MYIVALQKCGDDYYIPIPQEILDALGIQNDDQLEMRIEGEKLILRKVVDSLS